MLPLRDRVLRLTQIADHWARELTQIRSQADIHAELLGAFWLGSLPAVVTEGGKPYDRANLLRVINLGRGEHPGFVLVENATSVPPAVQDQPGGGALVDLTTYIVLPSDEASWTKAIIAAACQQFARVPFEEFSPLVRPALYALSATKDTLGDFCDQRGYDRPRFWFSAGDKRPRSFAGRPSVMRQIKAEMQRRAKAGQLAPKLREEATALHCWAEENISDGMQIPQVRAIENALRVEYGALRGAKLPKP
jgi:hypothetical protein